MSIIPPLSVTVTTKRRACVLDTDLALSRFGLLLALRVCDEFDLWLVRELWEVLDNTDFFLSQPELLAPLITGNTQANGVPLMDRQLREVLTQWEMARIETDLAGLGIYWIGDNKSESLLPKGVDQNLFFRFEQLAKSLESRIKPDELEEDLFPATCFGHAAALAAALIPYRGFILSHLGPAGNGKSPGEPAICAYLRRWGITCFSVPAAKKTVLEKEYLLPILGRTGISELMWAGLKPAVVHIVAPKAIIIPPSLQQEELYRPQELPPLFEEKRFSDIDLWEGAVSFWYPLRIE